MATNKRKIPDVDLSDIQTEVFDACGFGIIILDEYSRLLYWNNWLSKHSGLSLEDTKGEFLELIFPILDRARLLNAIDDALHYQLPATLSHKLNHQPFPLKNSKGNAIAHNIKVLPVKKPNEKYHCLIEITDISATLKREKQLRDISTKMRHEKEWANVTLLSIADAVITTDPNGHIIAVNDKAEALTGLTRSAMQGERITRVCPLVQAVEGLDKHPLIECLDSRQALTDSANFQFTTTNDTPYAVSLSVAPIISQEGELLGSVMTFRDITQSRNITAQLDWQSKHDHLTGLINRRELEAQLEHYRVDASQTNNTHNLLYIDLDQFKIVNDTCGHGVGDELIRQISDLLEGELRDNDVIARIGGDEFCIILPICPAEKAVIIAETLRQCILDHRFTHEEKPYVLGASIGIVEINGSENSAAEILSAADSACYAAKSLGRNRVHEYNPSSDSGENHPQEVMQWFSRLQSALEDDRFVLYAQKIADIHGDHEPHFEVLIRMLNDDGNIIPPNSFIPAAERFNLMSRIDCWVIKNVCEYLASLEKKNIPLPIISINLSGTSIGDAKFLETVLDIFEQYRLSLSHICFEITETAAISNLKEALNFMTEMKKRDCKFSLDDFGSGLSSFAYLKGMPVDYLKIDGHFIKNITHDQVDKAFVESISQIAQVMNIQTIAEFVENDDILDVLRTVGVDYAQGYGVSKPQPLDSIQL